MVAAACVAGAGVWWWPDSASGHGRYLADVSGCHGHGLSGRQAAGPDNLPPAANLTPAGLGRWTQADFVRAIREGRRPDGSAVNEFMPWRAYGAMTDAELESLSLYPAQRAGQAFGRQVARVRPRLAPAPGESPG